MTQPDGPHSEIVGLFHSPEALERAISELASAGWDRAEMSLLGAQESLSQYQTGGTEGIAHDHSTAHSAVVSKDDVRQMRTLTTGMAGVIAAFVTAGATIMTGGAALAAVVGAAAAGGGAAAAVEALGHNADQRREDHLSEQLAQGGILLWAVLRNSSDEAKAREILQRCGGTDVTVHSASTVPPQDKMMPLRRPHHP